MATIRLRGNRWQAIVRKTGYPQHSKTFEKKKDAERWSGQLEYWIETNGKYGASPESKYTLRDVLERYQSQITPLKKGSLQEGNRITRLLRENMCELKLGNLSPAVLSRFRDKRVVSGKRAAQYDLVIVRHALKLAIKEWGMLSGMNPVDQITIPQGITRRDRRLERGEYDALKCAAANANVTFIWPLIQFAIETAMRRSEILRLRFDDIDYEKALVMLHDTKNGEHRLVPLSVKALEIIDNQSNNKDRVFNISVSQARYNWDRVRSKAGISNLRFHDLRREAISRYFEKGLSIPEVQVISGHKTLSQLSTYTKLRAEDVSAKLRP